MNNENQIQELEKNRRLCAKGIPIHLGLLGIEAVALWILGRFFAISHWVWFIVLGLTAFTLIGDVFNWYYCGRKLKAHKHENAA